MTRELTKLDIQAIQSPKRIDLAMNPTKNTTATEASVNPSLRLFFFCVGVMPSAFLCQNTGGAFV